MTYIAKPVTTDSEVLNHIGRSLVVQEGEEFKLKRYFKVLTDDGVAHEVTFSQMDGLINILDTSRSVPPVTPVQYLVVQYDLKDLVALGEQGWVVPEYMIILMAETKTVRLEGLLRKGGHVDKEFTFALGGFDFLQQLSLARCIAALNKDLETVIGTFDLSYRFQTGPEGTVISTEIGV